MEEPEFKSGVDWRTKPTDRFILKWIKINLAARATRRLADRTWIAPWMATLFSAGLGVLGGVIFALGLGWAAGLLAAAAQVLDGVDGQLARLRGIASPSGAFLDSVMDRYPDGAMVIGSCVYLVRLPLDWPLGLTVLVGSMALIGGNLISYSTARAETLGLDLGPSTLASKGSRTTVMILGGWLSLFWPPAPAAALVLLALWTNSVVAARLIRTSAGRN